MKRKTTFRRRTRRQRRDSKIDDGESDTRQKVHEATFVEQPMYTQTTGAARERIGEERAHRIEESQITSIENYFDYWGDELLGQEARLGGGKVGGAKNWAQGVGSVGVGGSGWGEQGAVPRLPHQQAGSGYQPAGLRQYEGDVGVAQQFTDVYMEGMRPQFERREADERDDLRAARSLGGTLWSGGRIQDEMELSKKQQERRLAEYSQVFKGAQKEAEQGRLNKFNMSSALIEKIRPGGSVAAVQVGDSVLQQTGQFVKDVGQGVGSVISAGGAGAGAGAGGGAGGGN